MIVRGEVDISTAPRIERALDRLAARGRTCFLDLGGVTFMDSTGLRMLIDASRRAIQERWSFWVVRPSPPVMRTVEIAGLAGRLPLVPRESPVAESPAA